MIRLMILLTLAALAEGADAREEMMLNRYIESLAAEHQIEVEGISIVATDRILPEARFVSIDKSLARALHRYNYIVSYGENGPVRLTILGRRGTSVGALPEEYSEPALADVGDDQTQ